LKWDDVRGDTVAVRRALVRVAKAWELRPTKTHQQREVTLTPRAVALLDAHEKRQTAEKETLRPGRWQGTGLVFTDPIGRPLAPWVVTKAYKRLLKAAGLVGFRVYDLRHSMASVALASGEDVADVSKRLGHARVSTTLDVYAHTSTQSQRDVATRMSKLLG
jgi:integrase